MKEIVLAGACRTPIGVLGGALASVPAADLGALVIREALKRSGIPAKEVDVYKRQTIDAVHIAEKIGLGRRINMIMQTAFFALTQIIPVEKAVEYLKAEVKKNYGHQGQKVIDMNFDAIEEALKHIHKVDLRLLCRESGEERKQEICTGDADTDFFVNNIMVPMNPVSYTHLGEPGVAVVPMETADKLAERMLDMIQMCIRDRC